MPTLPSLEQMTARLRLKQLHLLSALADHGSLLKAAEKVSLTQPGASKALQEIEAIFGVPLFARSSRGLVATEMGHCAIRYARLMQTDLAHLRGEMEDILQGQGGRLNVGVIMGAVPLLTEEITRLLAQYPDVAVEIVEDTSARLLHLLDRGRLDVAICRRSVSAQPQLYDSIDIHHETLAVVSSIDHPMAGRSHLELADLDASRWVVYSANMPMRRLLEREFHEAGLRFPHRLFETTSAFATLALLRRQPDIVALLALDVAEFFASMGVMRILPLALKSRSEPYQLVTRRGAVLSRAAQLFMQSFRDDPEPSPGRSTGPGPSVL
ncbi:LysR family transcriptional regulator [Pollutimonas subterranea]|uniref:LysR family transcriptional regulator n=1 Tax=Pollutimonas subterranea TaxID=2045210 RepID=A0A2N4TZF6_9BURK|nr:LysR family transcriptional regulator [Pollutimonas subterranea]PLC48147.1 LysR family transcriptional regulator [Pollutimonas subterranea]